MIKSSLKTIALSLIVLSLIGIAHAWTEPTATPPAGNVSSPLNISSIDQYKTGGVGIGGIIAGYGDVVGINTPGNLSASKWLGQFTPLGVGSNSGYVGMEFQTIQNGGVGGPEQKLHLWTHRNGVLNSRALSIDGIGNVGIGTTNPLSRLNVQGTDVGISVMNAASNQNYYFGIKDTDSNKLYIGRGKDPSQGVPPAIVVNQQDKVGIGTTNPTAKLEIGGTAGVDGIKFPDGTVQTSAANSVGVFPNQQVFDGNGTWVAPINVTQIMVEMWGGGGGGGGGSGSYGTPNNNGGGGGGGSGGYGKKVLTVTPGAGYTIVIGGGGGGGSGSIYCGTAGGTGGTSSFSSRTTVLISENGSPGGNSGGNPCGGGAPGTGGDGTGDVQTANGGAGGNINGVGGAGASGPAGGGAGGAGGSGAIGTSGGVGSVPGGGGGGASWDGNGGAGASGRVIIWY